jgi:hypothetical protein
MPTDEPYRFLILTDSGANPRSFPASMVVQLEETYPYILRSRFKSATFYQLSFGNIATEDLVSQATAYLTHWRPHFVIVQSGLVDCRPEAFSEAQKAVINRLPKRFFGKLKRSVNSPALIKRRQRYRVPKDTFRKTAKKFKALFSQSTVLWLQICTAPAYENERPGVGARMVEYNATLSEVYGDGFVSLQRVLEVDGFNQDLTHYTVRGHQVIAELLLEKIEAAMAAPKARAIKSG